MAFGGRWVMERTSGVGARLRALPVGVKAMLAGWAVLGVVGVPLAFARGAGPTTVLAGGAVEGRERTIITLVTRPPSTTAVPLAIAESAPSVPAIALQPATTALPPPVPTTVAQPPTTLPPTTLPPTAAAPTTLPPTTAAPTTLPPTLPPPPTTAVPATTSPTVTAVAESACHPAYGPCVPVASDVDCAGGSGDGPAYVAGPVTVLEIGVDPYGLDADDDGVGCES